MLYSIDHSTDVLLMIVAKSIHFSGILRVFTAEALRTWGARSMRLWRDLPGYTGCSSISYRGYVYEGSLSGVEYSGYL